jgi:hypothetical protein
MKTSVLSLRLVLALALVAAGAPAVARAQQPTAPPPVSSPVPPAAAPSAQGAAAPAAPRVRRTVEIRAQAPAPEVITVRPRDVPQYTRRLLVPALLTPADTTSAVNAAVVVPAPASAEVRAAAASDRRTRTP